jgi:hypothetical protein
LAGYKFRFAFGELSLICWLLAARLIPFGIVYPPSAEFVGLTLSIILLRVPFPFAQLRAILWHCIVHIILSTSPFSPSPNGHFFFSFFSKTFPLFTQNKLHFKYLKNL